MNMFAFSVASDKKIPGRENPGLEHIPEVVDININSRICSYKFKM